MKHIPLLLALLVPPLAQAAPTPFAQGDAKAGAALHQEKCAACHVGLVGGDGSKLYTRKERKIKDASQLAQRITTCNANLGNTLFPEDEANLGAYLNSTFYKFKR